LDEDKCGTAVEEHPKGTLLSTISSYIGISDDIELVEELIVIG